MTLRPFAKPPHPPLPLCFPATSRSLPRVSSPSNRFWERRPVLARPSHRRPALGSSACLPPSRGQVWAGVSLPESPVSWPHSPGASFLRLQQEFFFFPLKPPASCHSGVQLCDCPAVASLLPGSGVSFGACVPCFLGRPRGPSRLEACGGQASRVRAHPEASSFTARR